MRHGVSSGGRRRVRVHGGRAAAAAGRPPGDRGRARHGRLQRRAPAWRRSTRRSAPRTRVCSYEAVRPRRPSTALDVVFLALPHGESQRLVPELVGRVAAPGRPRRRLPAPGRRVRAVVRRGARRARAPRRASRSGCSSCSARTITRRTPRRRARVATRRPSALALAPLLAVGLRRAGRHRRRRGVGRLGPRARAVKTTSLFSEANENVAAYGLLTHRHTGEMEQALGARLRRRRCRCCSRRTSCR